MRFVVSYSKFDTPKDGKQPIQKANPSDTEVRMKDNVIGGGSGTVGTSGVDSAAVSVPVVVVQGCTEWHAVHEYSEVFKKSDRPDVVFCCENRFNPACDCPNNLSMRGGK
jgi:hypothetical protein